MAYKRSRKPLPRRPVTGCCAPCGKVRYMTRADARHAATAMAKRMRAYRCPADGRFWHLASWQPQSRVTWYRSQKAPE